MGLTRPIREIITVSLQERGFGEETIDEIALVATEVVNNSFEHASDQAFHEVEIDMLIDDEKWVMKVRDEGHGRLRQSDFEFEGKGPPAHFGDRGRGTFLIWSFSDRVTVRDCPNGGTEVEIVKYRESQS
jgi:anti-sigma regulatory factor (Ser/Thr protein kinase)